MTITQLLTASARNLLNGNADHAVINDAREYVRQPPTGDPRLDLAHADRSYR